MAQKNTARIKTDRNLLNDLVFGKGDQSDIGNFFLLSAKENTPLYSMG